MHPLRRAPAVATALPLVLTLALALVPARTVRAEEAPSRELGRWLATPVVELPALAGDAQADPLGGVSAPIDAAFLPAEGDLWHWPLGEDPLRWEVFEGSELGEAVEGGPVRVRWLALHLDADGYADPELVLRSGQRLALWIDGEAAGTKNGAEAAAAEEDGSLEKKLALTPGRHVLVVRAATVRDSTRAWSFSARLEGESVDRVAAGLDPQHALRLDELLDVPSVRGLDLSPDGTLLAVSVRFPSANSEDGRSWVEFVETRRGRVLRTLEGVGALSGFSWLPASKGHPYSYLTQREGKSTLWRADFDGGRARRVLEDVEHFGGYRWLPDGATLVFSRSEEGAKDPEGFKRYRGLTDRWEGARDRDHLYLASADGLVRRLTAGDPGFALEDVAPDGRRLLVRRELRQDDQWPFSRTRLLELDLATDATRELAEEDWGLSAVYAPDGRQVVVVTHADAFGGVGRAVPDSVQINLYDSQAFLLDPESGRVTPLTRDFDPAIDEVRVSRADGFLYARATVADRRGIYRYDLRGGRWEPVDVPVDVVSRMSSADAARRLAFAGSGINQPMRLGVVETGRRPRVRVFGEVGAERYAHVRFGEVEDYDVALAGGVLDGRVYLPPGFDPAQKWPAIVYYYGGTSPVTRDFGGRYPKELWAAHGYVVYVPQPSGATGYGQEFAARHVNNWGKTVAGEIIAGTEAFLADHPYVDPERVGCIGASYGGFMTMLLTTRTDLFAAAVAHAGISAIGSYWGEGNWGFAYSAAATAKSYPWNRPDLYVDQSPLFRADRIHTPLLLLHGGADDNVPPGESEQLYTALRVLGREVEFVRIAGEKHWILSYDKRVRWAQSILAWFDRWLKGEPQWWEAMWPEKPVDED